LLKLRGMLDVLKAAAEFVNDLCVKASPDRGTDGRGSPYGKDAQDRTAVGLMRAV